MLSQGLNRAKAPPVAPFRQYQTPAIFNHVPESHNRCKAVSVRRKLCHGVLRDHKVEAPLVVPPDLEEASAVHYAGNIVE